MYFIFIKIGLTRSGKLKTKLKNNKIINVFLTYPFSISLIILSSVLFPNRIKPSMAKDKVNNVIGIQDNNIVR